MKSQIVAWFVVLVSLAGCENQQERVKQKAFVDAKTIESVDSAPVPAFILPEKALPSSPSGSQIADSTSAFSDEEVPREISFSKKLAQAALERTTYDVVYDGRYIKIDYPMGDVPASIGVCTDVVVRAYRQLGIDLQQLVHEDMRDNFHQYPNQSRWGLRKPDTNIDHRRVPNLRVFFSRHGESLKPSERPEDYQPGDLVTWKLNEKMVHIGIVAEQMSPLDSRRHYIIHNIGRGPELGDILFDFEITGHYRFPAGSEPD